MILMESCNPSCDESEVECLPRISLEREVLFSRIKLWNRHSFPPSSHKACPVRWKTYFMKRKQTATKKLISRHDIVTNADQFCTEQKTAATFLYYSKSYFSFRTKSELLLFEQFRIQAKFQASPLLVHYKIQVEL